MQCSNCDKEVSSVFMVCEKCWDRYDDLQTQLSECQCQNQELQKKADAGKRLLDCVKRFINNFESDYVLDGIVVDMPDSLLLEYYQHFKALAAYDKATKEG